MLRTCVAADVTGGLQLTRAAAMCLRSGDWYVTFGKLAGLSDSDMVDHSAAAAGLPAHDSLVRRHFLDLTMCGFSGLRA